MSNFISLGKELIPFCSEGQETFIPIKPFCEALGIDHSGQYRQIQSNAIYGATVEQKSTVAADGNTREMLCLPLKFFLFWITSISVNSIKEESKENVIRVQSLIFDAVYDRFFLEPNRQKEKLLVIREKELEISKLEIDRKELSSLIRGMKNELELFKDSDVNQLKLGI